MRTTLLSLAFMILSTSPSFAILPPAGVHTVLNCTDESKAMTVQVLKNTDQPEYVGIAVVDHSARKQYKASLKTRGVEGETDIYTARSKNSNMTLYFYKNMNSSAKSGLLVTKTKSRTIRTPLSCSVVMY